MFTLGRPCTERKLDELLGISSEAKALMSGLPPPAYEAVCRLVEDFTIGFLEWQRYGSVDSLDEESLQNLEEFIYGSPGVSIGVVGQFHMLFVEKTNFCPIFIIRRVLVIS